MTGRQQIGRVSGLVPPGAHHSRAVDLPARPGVVGRAARRAVPRRAAPTGRVAPGGARRTAGAPVGEPVGAAGRQHGRRRGVQPGSGVTVDGLGAAGPVVLSGHRLRQPVHLEAPPRFRRGSTPGRPFGNVRRRSSPAAPPSPCTWTSKPARRSGRSPMRSRGRPRPPSVGRTRRGDPDVTSPSGWRSSAGWAPRASRDDGPEPAAAALADKVGTAAPRTDASRRRLPVVAAVARRGRRRETATSGPSSATGASAEALSRARAVDSGVIDGCAEPDQPAMIVTVLLAPRAVSLRRPRPGPRCTRCPASDR